MLITMEIITLMKPEHWPAVKKIYQEGIDTGNATFQDSPPQTWEEWSDRHISNCSIVCLVDNRVIGWAAVSPVSDRYVYQGIGEASVYVTAEYWGMGIGELLLKNLITKSEQEGYWTLQAGIFPENLNSLQLHQKLGFQVVGTREKIGKMNYGPLSGAWRDVVLMERRSTTVGID